VDPDLEQRVSSYIEAEIDPADAEDLTRRLERARVDRGAEADLQTRFGPEPDFGTAGIRASLGPGPAGFNARTVARAVAATVDVLWRHVEDAPGRGVVIGHDARHRSAELAQLAAEIAVGRGFEVHRVPGPCPTPLVSHAVRAMRAAGGFMVTASHNPPSDNGLKVFGLEGAQIAPPFDAEIRGRREALPPAASLNRAAVLPFPRRSLVDGYVDQVGRVRRRPDIGPLELRVAYSPLQGVGAELFERVCQRHGVALDVVEAQRQPDPDFSATAHLNPEDPRALVSVLQLARDREAELVLVHDPDADRLAAAAPDGPQWRVLGGNVVGLLLADHLLRHDPADDPRPPLLLSTWVSSRGLDALARRYGAECLRTLTGFKWMAQQAARAVDGHRVLLAYEEAIGYAPLDLLRDKDGLSAGLALIEAATVLKESGRTLWDRWRELCDELGGFASGARSLAFPDAEAAGEAARGLSERPLQLPDRSWVQRMDFETGILLGPGTREALTGPRAQLVVDTYEDGSWVAIRPSGTEPKLKLYYEARSGPGPDAWARAEAARAGLEGALEQSSLGEVLADEFGRATKGG
jgi:phosphomannomutase